MSSETQVIVNESNCKNFFEYHIKNPSIYKKFKELTLLTISKGFKHYGSKGIFELIRWHTDTNKGSKPFKVNNIYTPYYSRLFEQEYPEHRGFFRTRKSKI